MEQSMFFEKFFEIENRPSFDPECSITLSNFGSLVGEYKLAEPVRCQVHRETGSCGNMHRHGWLGKTKDGKEGMIGNHCARKNFNADETFAKERNRIRSENSIAKSLNKLRELSVEDGGYETKLSHQLDRLRNMKSQIDKLKEKIPDDVVTRLEVMEKNRRYNVTMDIKYYEDSEDGSPLVRWLPHTVGRVEGVSIFNYSNIGRIFQRLHGIRDALEKVDVSRSAGERNLKRWADELEGIDEVISDIDTLELESARFFVFENLILLSYLTESMSSRVDVAGLALVFSGESDTKNSAKQLIDSNDNKMYVEQGGVSFRVSI